MFLYLVQHAEALSKEEDPSRCLSEEGLNNINKVAAYAQGLNITVGRILHSGKKRALQTAELLAEKLSASEALEMSDGLSPNDDPGAWAERLAVMERDIMLVGHLPHLAKLAALLLSSDRNIVEFENAGIVCMKRTGDGWVIDWIIKPGMVR